MALNEWHTQRVDIPEVFKQDYSVSRKWQNLSTCLPSRCQYCKPVVDRASCEYAGWDAIEGFNKRTRPHLLPSEVQIFQKSIMHKYQYGVPGFLCRDLGLYGLGYALFSSLLPPERIFS